MSFKERSILIIEKIGNKEWNLAEKIADEYNKSISKYFAESVSYDKEYIETEVLIPLTENINQGFKFEVPIEYQDATNSELTEYFNKYIHPIKEISFIPKSKYRISHMVIPLVGEYTGNPGVVVGINEATGDMIERSYLIHFEDIDKKVVLTESALTGDFIGFYEGTARVILPAWRGELYNYMHISDINNSTYNNYTLPPIYMKHIIENHSIRKRIDVILNNENFKSSIAKEIHCTANELNVIRDSIITKINVINGLKEIEKIPKDNHGHRKIAFNDKEERLISLVGYYDKYKRKNENGESGESKDHFPSYMSDHDIIKAIKEAYSNAEKVEIPRKKYSTQEDQVLFQGTSKDGLVIQFYYDFDYHEISTAYPVSIDTTNRPDLRHPGVKNKKRQN